MKKQILLLHLMTTGELTTTINPADSTLPVWYRMDLLHPTASTWEDSIPFSANRDTLPAYTTRFFQSHPSSPTSVSTQHNSPKNDWVYGSFAMILFMIVLLRILYTLRVNNLFRSFFRPGKTGADTRIFNFRPDLFSALFVLIYSMTFGLLAVYVIQGYRLIPGMAADDAMRLFFLTVLSFALFLLAKIVMIQASSLFFGTRSASLLYQDHYLMSAFITSALIIPLIVINAFSTSVFFLSSALLMIIILLIIRLIRVSKLGFLVQSFSYFHFILYFCTLEILPLLIIGKVMLMFLMR